MTDNARTPLAAHVLHIQERRTVAALNAELPTPEGFQYFLVVPIGFLNPNPHLFYDPWCLYAFAADSAPAVELRALVGRETPWADMPEWILDEYLTPDGEPISRDEGHLIAL